jgi:ABC-type branched-subunit amino acid transport system ATPase component
MSVLAVSDLRGGYGGIDILNGISLQVADREIVTVAGTNGAGKSTLAKAIVGLLPVVSGQVLLDGDDIGRLPPEERAARGIGYVPQVKNVFASLSVADNLKVVSGVRDKKRRMEELYEAFPDLRRFRRTQAGSLSGGERQQLAFARALMASPRVLVLDEPTAALEPRKVANAFVLIRSLPQFGVSVLVVEQRARQCLAVSDRGLILDGGRVALSGSADQLLSDQRAAELYLGVTHAAPLA